MPTGVEPVDLTDAVAAPEASMLSAPRAAAKRAPVRDLAAVEDELRDAERDLRSLGRKREQAERRAAELRAEATRLRAED